ncbi:hypothetical protein HYPSUDRAFT_66195 [Hypholoma sublateritium FD-334 SS-4]|uniref:tRNA N(3)-methylcytidine methyltransferase n=1 Tax=Hypholoma sublateritium (strain FD-334 SS-4) TaxID=945553 RepID=A0A0D2MIL8_HYPSF|nr:hypothetical protein HYPSUDRAFT_66195 [Hypholoma sublateritium FD-334 SS-4]
MPQALVEPSKKTTSSVQDVTQEKPAFGSRFLTDEVDVWSQNAWDHVPAPDHQVEAIAKSLSKQRLAPVPLEEKQKLNEKPAKHWDNFYKTNAANFFRDRKWLHNEFPELVAATQPDAGQKTIVEVGCGAGNSVFPLLSSNLNPDLSLHAYDYAAHAVKLVQHDPLYLNPPVGTIHAAVWDVTSDDGLPSNLVLESADLVIMVFVMSALHPDEWGRAVANVHKILKPGGLVLLRDYGRYDMTQLRFKGGRLLEENFYIRGDKTRVYFFEVDELSLLFTGSKAAAAELTHTTTDTPLAVGDRIGSDPSPVTIDAGDEDPPTEDPTASGQISVSTVSVADTPSAIHPNLLEPLADCPPHPLFATEHLGIDHRLIVNRKRQLKMYRVWMQAKFRKL